MPKPNASNPLSGDLVSPGKLNGPIGEAMDPEVRLCAVNTITRYARHHSSTDILNLIGFHVNVQDITDAMETAVIETMLPLLSDERLNEIMRHIAEILVRHHASASEVAS